jgi:Na+-transporting methylmalonyl-CoA/oxaloacetate decarboxylase gamma subunit
MDMHLIGQGLQVSIFGLCGVFGVLIVIYLATNLMLFFAKRTNAKNAKKQDEAE